MEPTEIASNMHDDADFSVCPKCSNMLSSVHGDEVACPNRRCTHFNREYRETLLSIMLPRGPIEGVVDYETLSSWVKLNATVRGLKREIYGKSVDEAIARQMAIWDSTPKRYHRKEPRVESYLDALYWGFDGYRGNIGLVNERLVDIFQDKQTRIDFLEEMASNYNFDMNYDDIEEEEEEEEAN